MNKTICLSEWISCTGSKVRKKKSNVVSYNVKPQCTTYFDIYFQSYPEFESVVDYNKTCILENHLFSVVLLFLNSKYHR